MKGEIGTIKELWRAMTDLLFPRCCAVCKEELLLHEKHICTNCLAEMPFTYFWCFKENPAFKLFYGRANIEQAYSLFYYTDSYKRAIHEFKYNSDIDLGLWLGQMLGSKIKEPIDYIIPIPLHYRKKWKRGFNQSYIIAKGIAKGISSNISTTSECEQEKNLSGVKILKSVLSRQIFTKTQTQKDRIERWRNVERVFAINKRAVKRFDLNGKHLLLVDDVFTTGATLDACCQILIRNCSCKISIATLAYVE